MSNESQPPENVDEGRKVLGVRVFEGKVDRVHGNKAVVRMYDEEGRVMPMGAKLSELQAAGIGEGDRFEC